MYPADLKYSKEHEWIKADGKQGRVGLTHHAQSALGDVVFVDCRKVLCLEERNGPLVRLRGTERPYSYHLTRLRVRNRHDSPLLLSRSS